ncbi:hypothetical protein [Haloactinopolyspora alba]|uniref:hypothetical protein n=1 Tax=Haloactinopolyspora alba TaxID=648780 RepID=UPI00101BDE56|nr:hypothetical protein [Haloactinopolyspora alba]
MNDVAASALESAVSARLSEAGINLQDGPDCDTDVTRDGSELTGTANCDGTATDGRAVRAEFDGTLSGSGCEGSLELYVDDQSIAQLDQIPDCSVSL